MGLGSGWHWIIILLVVLLLFGRDRIPNLMGDLAKGIKAFKSGIKDEPTAEEAAANAPNNAEVKKVASASETPVSAVESAEKTKN